MKKLLVCFVLLAGVVVAPLASGSREAQARPAACDLPDANPMWVDFGDGSVPFWDRIFRRPGLVVAASNFLMPPQLRAGGAKTVYFDLNLKTRVGTPTAPLALAQTLDWGDRMYLRGVASAGCEQPVIALNELFGAGTVTPWTDKNAQYRANVLAFVQRLSGRGAKPVLLVSSPPWIGGEAADWWRQVAGSAQIVRQVYFSARHIHELGPVLGSRVMRDALRRAVQDFTEIGIQPSRLGLMLGFQTRRGTGGREGLKPRQAWYRIVKLEALAARLVAKETGIGSIWSWGWASWTEAERDPDKEAAACVWLWTRDSRLCDGPTMAGKGFEPSLTEGQPPSGRKILCLVGAARMTRSAVDGLAALTGERAFAASTLLARLAMREQVRVPQRDVLGAERAIVKGRFGGSWARYGAALKRARASRTIALGAIADELMRREIAHEIRVGPPSERAVVDYYETFSALRARPIEARPRTWWLGDRRVGLALEGLAPEKAFSLPEGVSATLRNGEKIRLRALGEELPLGAFPLPFARPAIRAALVESARESAFQNWLTSHMTDALRRTSCARDDLPIAANVDLVGLLPFLALP